MNGNKMIWHILVMSCSLCLGLGAWAQTEDDHYGPLSVGSNEVPKWTESMRQKYASDEGVLIMPGVVADRSARQVEVLVEATGLATGETPEFILVDQDSSHGYEALFWSMAKPSDIHRALEHVGLVSGGSIDPAALRFWPKGDRVNVGLRPMEESMEVPIEATIYDEETEDFLEEEGFVFTGSVLMKNPDDSNKPLYAADVYDPMSIIPLYNDPFSVLDVPRQAPQGDVFGRYGVSRDAAFEGGEMMTMIFTPAVTEQDARSMEYTLNVSATNQSSELFFSLQNKVDSSLSMTGSQISPIVEKLSKNVEKKGVPVLTLDISPEVPVGELSNLGRLLVLMEMVNQVRIMPPLAGQLYYRAFVPSPDWAKPSGRPTQPWELHFEDGKEGALSVELVLHENVEEEGKEPQFSRKSQKVASPQDLRSKLIADALQRELAGGPQLPAVILVFSKPDLAYQTLLEYIGPVLDLYRTIYVFTEQGKAIPEEEEGAE